MATIPNLHVRQMLSYHRAMDELIPDKTIIFLGDSITQGLATVAVAPYTVNYGIGGQTATELLDAISSYKSLGRASVIVLTIGINDIRFGMSEGLNERYRKIEAALPRGTPLIWNSVMPANLSALQKASVVDANHSIMALCQKRTNCVFLKTSSFLADANGEMVRRYFYDDVHLNSHGYRQWISALKNAIQQIANAG